MELSAVEIAGVRLANPLMNGAYIGSKTTADVTRLVKSATGAVVVGSISVKPRQANPGQGFWMHKEGFYALNSFGMPNGGLPYFQKHLPAMVKEAHANYKPLIANVIGFTPSEFAKLVQFADQAGADMIELNLGCPNVWEGNKQEQIFSYHPKLVSEILLAVSKQRPSSPLIVKISPLPPDTLRDVTAVLSKSPVVSAVTATNSFPNAALSTGTRQNEETDKRLVGLAGRALKPISLGVVTQLRTMLPDRIAIIGSGGIYSLNDVRDFLSAGASAVQMATALVENGPHHFTTLLSKDID